MLRINPSADAGYYLGSVNERESPGVWDGRLAMELGLSGADVSALKAVLSNRTPEGKRLTPIDQANRREGYDLTFSEPKSVSIMEQVAGDRRIGQARRDSVDEIMAMLVEPRATTRRWNGRFDEYVTTGNLAYLTFDHLLARPDKGMPDPNGHVHVVVANATEHNGKRTALEIRPIKEAAPFIEAAWHALYASKIQALGYPVEKSGTAFEIVGVSKPIRNLFSNRTASVETEFERRDKALSEQIKHAASDNELRLLEGRVARLKSPKGKAALGPMIREKKMPLLDQEGIQKDWVGRLSAKQHKELLTLHNQAVLGKQPEPELPMGMLGKALSSLRDAMEATQKPQDRPEAPSEDKFPYYLSQALETALQTNSRVTEERLLTLALKAGVGEVTLPSLRETLDSDHFRDATKMVAAGGLVSTRAALRMEEDVTDYARRGKLAWVKNKVDGLPDAGKMTFPELHALVTKAGDKHLVIAGDARGNREGQPLKVLRDLAGMKPIGEPSRVKKPNVVSVVPTIRGWKARMKAQVSLIRKLTYWRQPEGVERVRSQEQANRGIER